MLLNIAEIVSNRPLHETWRLPSPRVDLAPTCLTDLLATIPEFRHALLPAGRSAITRINRVMKAAVHIPPCEETRRMGLYSSVGLAVDRGALLLLGQDITSTPLQLLKKYPGPVARRLIHALEVYKLPNHADFARPDLIGLLYVLGTLEPVFRGFRPLSDVDISRLSSHGSHRSVQRWLEQVLEPSIGDEIATLLQTVAEIAPDGPVHPNPIFGHFGPILGSDGDWIAADTLVELKCTTSGMRTAFLIQLLCYYALSQLPDRQQQLPRISKLAVCLPRQSTTVIGTVDAWLQAFGAPSSPIVVEAIHQYFGTYSPPRAS